MRLSGQFQVCSFFFYEKILNVRKEPKRKETIFTFLEKNCPQKIVAFVVICSLNFVLLVGLCL